jgi:hypothetical protein
MASKGIVFSREKDGIMGYSLLPTIPGLFEFPFMKGGGEAMHAKLAKLWEEYHLDGLGNSFAGSTTPLTRVIPIEETVDTRSVILPYEQISEMVAHCKTFALGPDATSLRGDSHMRSRKTRLWRYCAPRRKPGSYT